MRPKAGNFGDPLAGAFLPGANNGGRRDDNRVEIVGPSLDVFIQGPQHATLPELVDVGGHRFHPLLLGQVGELVDDLIAHPDDVLGEGRHRDQEPVTADRSSIPVSARSSISVSEVGATWTAVTLYSGQLVAQSENSVVTTLAPVTG